ncbi:hypothetical protein AURDEDRAFT_27198, partial [Auricularia subglabra TFB-10046 SS5]
PLTAPAGFDAPGIPLEGITQSVAAKAIRTVKSRVVAPRRATCENLEKARQAMSGPLGYKLADEEIWRATQHRDISRNARTFLWRTVHDAHRCGSFLANW